MCLSRRVGYSDTVLGLDVVLKTVENYCTIYICCKHVGQAKVHSVLLILPDAVTSGLILLLLFLRVLRNTLADASLLDMEWSFFNKN